MEMQRREMDLRALALDRADSNEKAQLERLKSLDTRTADFADRGQKFAMWLAGVSTALLLVSGVVCIFLTIAGDVTPALGYPAAGILIAGGVITGISNLVKHFLPGDHGGDDKAPRG